MLGPVAKLKTDPIALADLQAFLAANDDFAFELRCLRELSQRGITVDHAGTYADPVTGKNRQFDFRFEMAPEPQLRVAIALECKNLKPFFPLMVSRLPRLPAEAFHEVLVPRNQGHVVVQQVGGGAVVMNPSETVTLSAPASLYAVHDPVGKSTVQVGRLPGGDFQADDAEVYEKWSQAVSSAYDLCAKAHYGFANFAGPRFACFILPVVVVPDGMLWVTDYQADGAPAGVPTQTNETTFYLNHSSWRDGQTFRYVVSHLHFVTLAGLGSLVDRVLVNGNFRQLLRPAVV